MRLRGPLRADGVIAHVAHVHGPEDRAALLEGVIFGFVGSTSVSKTRACPAVLPLGLISCGLYSATR